MGPSVGRLVGDDEGCGVGRGVGAGVGPLVKVGTADTLGAKEGCGVGCMVGAEGCAVGKAVGMVEAAMSERATPAAAPSQSSPVLETAGDEEGSERSHYGYSTPPRLVGWEGSCTIVCRTSVLICWRGD